jgi:hypothetical protein
VKQWHDEKKSLILQQRITILLSLHFGIWAFGGFVSA